MLTRGVTMLLQLLLTVVAMAAASDDNSPTSSASTTTVLLEDFSSPAHKWKVMNDPVMGGKSHSALEISNGVAHYTGTCAIVPFLHAPGFITMETGGGFPFPHKEQFPDIRHCEALSLELKTNVAYEGYRVSFGREKAPGGRHAQGYKAPLEDLPLGEFETVTIPFRDFSSKWDDATGDILIPCKDDEQYCPSDKWLQNIKTISIWGEGVEGDVDLEIKTIMATGCNETKLATFVDAYETSSMSTGTRMMTMLLTAAVVVSALVFLRRRRQQNDQKRLYNEVPEQMTAGTVEIA